MKNTKKLSHEIDEQFARLKTESSEIHITDVYHVALILGLDAVSKMSCEEFLTYLRNK